MILGYGVQGDSWSSNSRWCAKSTNDFCVLSTLPWHSGCVLNTLSVTLVLGNLGVLCTPVILVCSAHFKWWCVEHTKGLVFSANFKWWCAWHMHFKLSTLGVLGTLSSGVLCTLVIFLCLAHFKWWRVKHTCDFGVLGTLQVVVC